MPFVSTKIRIDGTKYDRRRKLTIDQRKQIINLHNDGKSIHSLAKKFDVSRRLIQFITNPEAYKENRKRHEENGGWRLYYDKGSHTRRIREHRTYKQQLYVDGLIDTGK